MSTRYVWEKYNTTTAYQEKITTSVKGADVTIALSASYDYASASSYTFSESNGIFTLTNPSWGKVANNGNDASYRPYAMMCTANSTSAVATGSIIFFNKHQSEYDENLVWKRIPVSTGSSYATYTIILVKSSDYSSVTQYNAASYAQKYALLSAEEVKIQGSTLIGKASGSASNFYPSNGTGITSSTSGNWYIYKGSDNIDPTSVSYSNNEPKGGEEITVTVTPRGNTYGGTIYYQYSYSTNGGVSWTSSGDKTTDTSKTFTVPTGVTQLQVRVQASDDMGFTSTDYVTGANLTVISMLAYIGVAEKARKVDKIYIGVNGKAREVIAGYIGINGKARKFL